MRPFRALLPILLCLAPLPAHATIHRIALVVGNNEGGDTKPFLRYAEQDAKNFARTLTEIGGFSPPNVRLLLGRDARDVLEAASKLRAKASRLASAPPEGGIEDQILFVFYFSGHSEGTLMELGPSELDFRTLHTELKKISGATRIVILDTCEGGHMIQSKGGTPIPSFTIPQETGRLPQGEVVITSSMPLEDSIESSEFQGSLFTQTFISGLRGAADFDLDGRVSLSEALSFAGQYTPLKAEALKRRQHPAYEFGLSGSGEIYLSELMKGAPLLFLSPPEEGTFLIYNLENRLLAAEVPKTAGGPRYVALPPGELSIRRISNSDHEADYYEQNLTAEWSGLYYFEEDSAKRGKLAASRRIDVVEAPLRTEGRTLPEGETVRLRLMEPVKSDSNHPGDQVRLESAEDVYVNGRLVISAGAHAKGEILGVRPKQGFAHGALVCRLGYVRAVDGQWVPLEGIISRSPSGLREVPDVFMGREVVIKEGSLLEAFVARDTVIR